MDLWRYFPILPAMDAAKSVELFSAMVDAIDKPDIDSIRRLQAVDTGATALPPYALMAKILMPSLTRAAQLWVRGVGMNHAILAAMACERHRLAHGDWPDDLPTLVPEFLEAVPVDPFDGQPIHYQRIPEGMKVWTIGEDLVDNGGDVMRLAMPKGNKRPTDFGWVLLNPDLRGQPAVETDQRPEPNADQQ